MLQFFRAVSALTVSMDLIDCFWREADRLADAQGHGFVIAATRDLERQRQSDRRSRRDCVWAVTVRASHLSRAIERQVRGAYELQCGDRSNDLNKLPKASCRHRNTLLVVFP